MPPLALWDIDDCFGFVSAIVTKSGLELSREDRDDLCQFLAVQAWELSVDFRPGQRSFSSYAGTILRRRVVDFQRQRFRTRWVFRDRVYERPRPELVPLDDDSARDRLGHTLASGTGDPADDCDSAFAGLYEDRNRQRARDLAELGLEPAA